MYEQNRGLRVLIRRLMAGQEVAIRLEGEPAPPAAPGPSRPRVALPPVIRKRTHDGVSGPGDTTVRLGRSKPAAVGLEEERPQRSTRQRVEVAPEGIVETSSSDDSVSDTNYPSTRQERLEQRRGDEAESSDETMDESE